MWTICVPIAIIVSILLIIIYYKLTTDKYYEDTIMIGKVAIITGGSKGIGYHTALNLAKLGATVIIAARNERDGERAVHTIVNETGNNHVQYMKLDLSSLESVRKFVENFKKQKSRLDLLINNAGVNCFTDGDETCEGIIRGLAINHFGPFLLTVLLTSVLKKSSQSRVINVTSSFYKFGKMKELNVNQHWFVLYCKSKLCNVLFTMELSKRISNEGVTVSCVDPGFVNTHFYKGTFLDTLRKLFMYIFIKSVEVGSQSCIYPSTTDDYDLINGKMIVDCKVQEICPNVANEGDALKLWYLSEELVGLRPNERI